MLPLVPGTQHVAALPYKELERLDWLELVLWCAKHARYSVVTRELVQWLKELIGNRSAIEVGAGQGDLGYALGIPMSDSYVQTDPMMQLIYRAGRQAPTMPPPNVERLPAEAAVRTYKPDVVIASWLTQKWQEGDEQAFVFGADEEWIIANCATYVHIGNLNVHRQKRILRLPHEVYSFPWLWSRAREPGLNRIWVWRR